MDLPTLAATSAALVAVTFLHASSQTAPCPYVWNQNLTIGSVGEDVKALQMFLNSDPATSIQTGKGSAGQESTYFGAATKAAVVKFQSKHAEAIFNTSGTKASGFVGPATRAKLNTLCGAATSTPLLLEGASSSMRVFSTTSSSSVIKFADNSPISSEASSTPTLTLQVNADERSGWNLNIRTSNFNFSPQTIGLETSSNRGYADVLVDGATIGRAYSEWFYIPKLSNGSHIVSVILKTSDFKSYVIEGAAISAEVKIVVGN